MEAAGAALALWVGLEIKFKLRLPGISAHYRSHRRLGAGHRKQP